MKIVKCKTCNCDIYAEYNVIESINDESFFNFLKKKKSNTVKKYLSELHRYPIDDCNTAIYLTCDNGHTMKYFCKIESISC